MKKQAESASCRPPSFHHILRIIVMMLLCMVCATPQSAAKTTTIKFPTKSPYKLERINQNHYVLDYIQGTDTIVNISFVNDGASTNVCNEDNGGLIFKKGIMVITAKVTIKSVTFVYSYGKINLRNTTQTVLSGQTKIYDVDNVSRGYSVTEETYLQSITIETPDASPITYKVTISPEPTEGGTIAIIDKDENIVTELDKIANGTTLKVKPEPAPNYEVEQIMANDLDITNSLEFTVDADTEITATFKKKTYPVTLSDCTNGSFTVATASGAAITDNSEVEHGTELTITPTPAIGYKTVSVSVNGTALTENQGKYSYTITGPTTIAITFEADNENFTILSFSQPQNGTLTVTSTNSTTSHNSGDRIPVGTQLTVTATPSQGYKLTGISAGKESKSFDTTGEGTLEATTTAGTFNISATFEEYKTYAVAWTQPNETQGSMTVTNGEKEITDGTNIENGTVLTVTLEANDGYTPSLKVNGTTAEATSTDNGGQTKTYTVTVTASTTLTPEFTKNIYKITIINSENGTVTVSADGKEINTGGSVEHGTELTITPKPNQGYKIASLLINNISVNLEDGKYVRRVKEDVSIQPTFTTDMPSVATLTIETPQNGTLIVTSTDSDKPHKTGDEIAIGSKLTITATPDTGYRLKEIRVGTTSYTDNTPIIIDVINSSYTISAVFEKIPTFSVAWSITNPNGGSITVNNGSTPIVSGSEVESGTTLTVTLTPEDGFIAELSSDVEGSVMETTTDKSSPIRTYEVTVTKATSLSVSFTKKQYAITIVQPTNGTVTVATASGAAITGNNTVEHGTELTITPIPTTGYKTVSVSVNGTALSKNQDNKYTYIVTRPTTIAATFETDNENFAILSFSPPQNGTITVTSTNSAVPHESGARIPVGTQLTVTAKPAQGYKLSGISAGQVSKSFDTTGEGTLEATTTAGTFNISATFEEYKAYAVAWTQPDAAKGTMTVKNGEKEITGGTNIENETKLTVTLEANEGYTPSLKVNGTTAEATSTDNSGRTKTYTVTVTASTTLTPEFTKNSYTLTIADSENGDITVMANNTELRNGSSVEHGTELTITPTHANGYKTASVSINGTILSKNQDNKYTYIVTEAATIAATFEADNENFAILSFSQPQNGTLTVTSTNSTTSHKSGDRIPVGTQLTVTATPSQGYKLTRISAGQESKSFDTTGEGTLEATTTAGTFNISATFEAYKAYAVTWTQPDVAQGTMTVKNGEVEITSGTEIENGTKLTVTLEANEGYTPSLKVNGTTAEATSTDNSDRTKTYTVTVTASTILTPEFTRNSYTLTIADSENGNITVMANNTELRNGSSVEHGTELTITPTPATGYKLSSLTISTGDNDVALNSQPYTHTVKGPVTIKATFVGDDVNYSNLSFSDSEGGKILVTSPYNNVVYKTGDRITVNTPLLIKAIPNADYKLTRITAGNRSKEFNTTKEDTLRCIATAGPFDITAVFTAYKAYAVAWTQPDAAQGTMTVKNGEVEITSGTEIESGTTLSGTLRAAEGHTPSLKINGNLIDAKSTTDEGRTKNYDIIVTKATTLTPLFTKNKYTVSIPEPENGTITVATASGATITGNNTVEHGTELTITPTPAYGYKTASVSVNGKPLAMNQGKCLYTITEAATITARFEVDNEKYATLTIIRPENGTLTVTSAASKEPHKNGDLVAVGTKLTIKARPADGYRLKGITAGSVTYPFDDTIEKTAEPDVTKGTYTISAQIEKIELHTVSWTNANPDGGTITVTHGTGTIASGTKIETDKEVIVTLTAKEGYTPSLESDVSGSLTETATGSEGLVKIYKVTITKATTLTAKFIKKQPDKATVKYEPTGEGTVAFFSDAALTKPIDTTDGLKIEIGTTVYVKATPTDSNYEAKVIYSTDGSAAQTLTPDSNGIFQFVAADEKATLAVSFVIRICDVKSRITCPDGDAAKAGTIEWKLSGSKTYDNPAKVECGKTINVRIKAAEGYRITAASGATITEDARITDIPFDLTVTKETEITATFKAIPRVTINLDTDISGLTTETQGKVKVTVATSDGTPVSATDKVEEGTKLRIVASTEDNRYRFTQMSIGDYKATISENGATAVIEEYTVKLPETKTLESSLRLTVDIVMARRTVAVTFASDATNALVTVTSTDENGNRKSIESGTTVSVDTELLFRATPDAGYEIESMTVTPTVGTALSSTSADIDTQGVCALTARTPVSLDNNPTVAYKIEVTSRQKQDGQIYKMHYVTLAIADGQAEYGSVRFVDPKSEGMTVATERKVTFEATPADMPTDGRLGRYSFAGWSSDITVRETEREATDAARVNAVYSYGGDSDATFTASFIKNCQLTFEETHTGGTMTITGPDGALIESGDFVAPGTEITVTVTATPSTGYRVNLIIINGAAAYLYEEHPETVTQTVTVEADMTLGCDIFIPSGIDDIDTDDKKLTWYTLNGIRLGGERPTQTGIYIVVDHKGRTRKVAITAD